MISKFLQKYTEAFQLLVRTELVFLIILVVAIGVRVWQLDTKMIFFGDIGRDLLVAKQMVEEKEIPLLGIPSSVPRFRQGPVMIWYVAFWLWIGNLDPVMAGYGSALISILAIALMYWFVKKTVNQPVAWLATFILATSPLAIAHARMPYHISPIPFALTLYIIAIWRVWQKKNHALFWACASWGFLFQFELAAAPLILLIPYTLWRTKASIKSTTSIIQVGAGFGLGLLPQIVYDLTNNFQHLGGFVLWILYRIAAFGGYNGEHRFGIERFLLTIESFDLYWGRILSFDQPVIKLGLLILFMLGIWQFWHERTKLPITIEISLLMFLVLSLAYVVHGSPSEAYFPPYLILLPILLCYVISKLPKIGRYLVTLIVILIGTINLITVIRHDFFIGDPNIEAFTYGPGYQEHLDVARIIIQKSDGRPYALRSTAPGSHHNSYLDSYRYLTEWLGTPESAQPAVLFFVDYHDGELNNYPLSTVYNFDTVQLIQIE